MENLHPDIKLNILSRLPVESVYQCKLVCKTWRTLLRNTKMGLLFSIGLDYDKCGSAVQLYYGGQYDHEINNIDDDDDDDDKHNDYSSYKTLTKIDHPPITERPLFDLMLGSCNGLVCFFVPHDGMDDPIYICNPITGEYVYLPRFTCGKHASSHHKLVGGFGYLHSTNEYKVVRTYYDYDEPSLVGHVQVYTLGDGNGWRNKGDTTHFIGSSGVFANGYLHWIDIGAKKNIVAFDLAEEEFRLLPSPPCLLLRSRNLVYFSLQLLGGCLCVVCIDKGKCVDIWALKNKKKKKKNSRYDDEDRSWSWSREFSIAWEGPVRSTFYAPFAFTKNNEVLLWYNEILSCYDPKTANLKKLWDDDTRLRYTQAIPHMNSLVSLKALGEKSLMRRR